MDVNVLNPASDPKEHFNLGLHTKPIITTGLLTALATIILRCRTMKENRRSLVQTSQNNNYQA